MADKFPGLRVAFAHYWFVTWRGGEKVAKSILDIFPDADVYTLFFDKSTCGQHLVKHTVRASVLDREPIRKRYQKAFPLYPMGVRSLKLDGNYDLLISSESGPIKGIGNPGGAPHLSYVHTPMRYCWGFTDDYLRALPSKLRPAAAFAFERLRRYDETTIDNVSMYVANSLNVSGRIRDYYKRDASVVYPPISLDLFDEENLVKSKASKRDYYLSFGAITPYKGIDLLVDVFNRNGRNLIVIGDGSERKKLEALGNDNIKFTGSLPDRELKEYILGAKALLFPGEEDFGMVPLEVMARGIPVLAYGKGGALETVVDFDGGARNATGMFFHEKRAAALQEVIDKFEKVQDDFDPVEIRAHARLFGEDHFQSRFAEKVGELLSSRHAKTDSRPGS